MARPDRPPLRPPTDLRERSLLLTRWRKPLYRVHARQHHPVHFGRTGRNRFDDPLAEFGVLYTSTTLEGAFSETFADISSVTVSSVAARAWTELNPTRPLNLCDLTQHGLRAVRADGRLCTGAHAEAQQWSRAIWSHPASVDGICYHARTNLSMTSVAIFDRAAAAVAASHTHSFLDEHERFTTAQLLDRYQIALLPE